MEMPPLSTVVPISPDGILCQVGHEDQHDIRIGFPHPVRRFHSVHVRHIAVHEDDVRILMPAFQKVKPVGVPCD